MRAYKHINALPTFKLIILSVINQEFKGKIMREQISKSLFLHITRNVCNAKYSIVPKTIN
jgi:hypothetical protein